MFSVGYQMVSIRLWHRLIFAPAACAMTAGLYLLGQSGDAGQFSARPLTSLPEPCGRCGWTAPQQTHHIDAQTTDTPSECANCGYVHETALPISTEVSQLLSNFRLHHRRPV